MGGGTRERPNKAMSVVVVCFCKHHLHGDTEREAQPAKSIVYRGDRAKANFWSLCEKRDNGKESPRKPKEHRQTNRITKAVKQPEKTDRALTCVCCVVVPIPKDPRVKRTKRKDIIIRGRTTRPGFELLFLSLFAFRGWPPSSDSLFYRCLT